MKNPCKIKHVDSVLQFDDAGNLTVKWGKHGEKQTLIKLLENKLFSDYGDLTINRTQQTSIAGQGQETSKPIQILTLRECPGACMTPADVTWKSNPFGNGNYPNS